MNNNLPIKKSAPSEQPGNLPTEQSGNLPTEQSTTLPQEQPIHVSSQKSREEVLQLSLEKEAELQERFNAVVALVSTGEVSMTEAQKRVGIPACTYLRLVKDNEDNAKAHQEALEARSEYVFDEMLQIADDDSGDLLPSGKTNMANVQRDKLRLDTRRWILGRINPKKFGEKMDITSDNEALGNSTINIAYRPPIEE